MEDQDKTREQLTEELGDMRRRVGELEASLAERLRVEAGQYIDLYEEAPLAYLSVGVDGGIRRANKEAVVLLGQSEAELVGSPVLELYADTPDGKEKAKEVFQRFIVGEEIHSEELEMRRGDGGSFWVSLSVRPVLDDDGRVVESRSVLVDINDRKRAEEVLVFQAHLLENVSEAVISTDMDFVIRSWNKGAEATYGYGEEEVIGKGIAEVTGIEYPYHRQEEVVQAFLVEGYWEGEVIQRRKDGQAISVLASVSSVRDRAGQALGVVAVNRDITERRRAEEERERLFKEVWGERRRAVSLAEELGRERDLLQTIMDCTQAQLAYLDPNMNFVRVNSPYARGSGHKVEELVGRNYFELFPDAENQAIFEGVRNTGEAVRFGAKPFVFPDRPELGTTYWDWVLDPVKGSDGEVRGLVLSRMDVTERVRAEEGLRKARDELELVVAERTAELRASEERYRALFENAGIGIGVSDMEGRWLASNPALERMLGYNADELAGLTLADLSHPDDVATDVEIFGALMAGKRDPYARERRFVRKDGSVLWGNITTSITRGVGGEPAFVIGTVEDITERKLAQEALLNAEKLAVAGQLAASLAHEINNPLQAVIGCLGLAEETLAEGGDVSRYLQVALEELRRAAATVGQLRELQQPSELEEPRLTDINEILQQVLTLTRKRCEDRGVEVDWKAPVDLPRLAVMPDRMRQVFLNLVLNAVDAMPDGGCLSVRAARASEPAGVQIVFRDSGVGIGPEDLPHIFDPFYSTKAEGMGLGLYISQNIVHDHHGHIVVESQPGEGTAVTVWLPV